MTDTTANTAGGHIRAARTPLTRRFRFGSSASGVGHAGWGRTIGAAIVSFVYFFPVFWTGPPAEYARPKTWAKLSSVGVKKNLAGTASASS